MNDIYTILPFLFLGIGWTWGVHCLFEEDYLLHPIAKAVDWLPDWVKKPLHTCPICMSSIHGSLIFMFFIKAALIWWPVYCISLCGFNYIIHSYVALQEKE